MAAQLIDGRAIAARIRQQIQDEVAALPAGQARPTLAGLLIGPDEPSRMYASAQARTAGEAGVDLRLLDIPGSATMSSVCETIIRLNHDASVHGIVLYQPLPPHLDLASLQAAVAPEKDVEGVNPSNFGQLALGRPALAPCTAAAAFECVRATGIELAGREAVVVGRSAIVGRPVAMLLLREDATVTQCHSKTQDLPRVTRRGEILIVAAGEAGLIGAEHVRPGAIVIDVGTHRIEAIDESGRTVPTTVGDVRFDEVSEIAGAITPVPGGVGPVTVAMLLSNVVSAARAIA